MGVDLTRDQSAYGVGQPLIGVPNKPIISDRNPTANDKATLGQIWVNPTVNTAFILVSINNNAAIWAIQATPIAGNIIVPGFVQAGTGFIALAGGADITGNSTFHNDVTISGDLMLPGGDLYSAGGKIYADDFITITNPAIGLDLNENGIYGYGTDANIDVSVIPKGTGAFVIDGLWGGVLLSQWRFRQASVQTVDGAQTLLFTIPIADSEMVLMKAYINGFKDDYLHALSGEVFISGFRPHLGNVTQIGAKVTNGLKDNGAAATVAIDAVTDIPTQSLQILVTGAVGETWNWVVTANFMYTTHP
jgi:hypothetical protein